jgi:hypothetical protein
MEAKKLASDEFTACKGRHVCIDHLDVLSETIQHATCHERGVSNE